jgi:hypothetical protein
VGRIVLAALETLRPEGLSYRFENLLLAMNDEGNRGGHCSNPKYIAGQSRAVHNRESIVA